MSDILGIGPHPDDIELAAGGTLARLSEAGHSITLLDLTRGERATRGTPETRAKEAEAAAAVLRASRENLGLPDGGVSARDPAQVAAVVDALRRHRPRLVLAMHRADDHPDHIEGGDLVPRAAYLSGVRNYPRPGEDSFRPPRVLYAMGRRSFEPSLVVDVTAVYETKRRALAAYQSQFFREADDSLVTPISDPEFLPRLEARDRHYGGMIGVRFGEPFLEIGPVRVDRPSDLLGEARS